MRIGVDFDNTIIGYGQAFASLASERGLMPEGLPPTKLAIRDHLRATGRENEWTMLQAEAYGPGIVLAAMFPGALEFFRACRERSVPVFIVSHKTARPYLGPDYDLHFHARDWLDRQGFFAPDKAGLDHEAVFFEPTKALKAQRIRDLGVTRFIDDLPEFLAELDWTPLERILFDPEREHEGEGRYGRVTSWDELLALLPEDGK